ncbi:PREDICTED: uncharacterized protein LOC109482720 [Branchiostoma belcheri]|uniref:Uncharacterized protein LOC109482720 n=1 Tax=Branchiostoma belcheri TaxID=7741 RepID=A0A6P5ACS7_BRABE|nr:PREDICTED: uncharacterized protein LOC109482720 [Branchiostoma belcheri]
METIAVSTEREGITTPKQTGSSENADEEAADIETISTFPVSRGFINAMYEGGSSEQGERPAIFTKDGGPDTECIDPGDNDSQVYHSINEDDIENQQKPDTVKQNGGQPTEKDTKLPSQRKRDDCMHTNTTYSSGVQDKETKFACWRTSLYLSCPEGEALSIDHANFGRTTTSIFCPCTTCDTNCRAANSLAVMKGACEGYQQCSVSANSLFFGDPCFGTQKYLEATYHCVKVIPVTNDQLGALVRKHAPKVWLAKGEKFNPSSIDFHLRNVKVHDGGRVYSSTPSTLPNCTEACYMSTAQPLPHPDSTLPFFSGEQIGPTRQPPVYAVIKRVNSITTDIFYWMFFPYNLGKKVCVGFRIKVFNACAGKYKTFGHRVGDWEHMTIRLVGKYPSSIYVHSPHKSAGIYTWEGASQTYRKDDDIVLTEGTHPILYSAYGGHKLWPCSGTHKHMTILRDKQQDETNKGTAWDTWKNVTSTMYRPDGGYTGSWTWMNFKGRWGNKEAGCDTIKNLGSQCTLNNGISIMTSMKEMKTDELD